MFGLRKLGRQRMVITVVGVAIASTIALEFFAHGSIDYAYYATFTRLSGLLLGSTFAFSFAPYRIRGTPGPGCAPRARRDRRVRHVRAARLIRHAAPLRPQRVHVPDLQFTTTSRFSTVVSCSSTSRRSWSSPRPCTPPPTSGARSDAGRCSGSACARTAFTSGTIRSSASPGRGSTSTGSASGSSRSTSRAGRSSPSASSSRSAPPNCRSVSSRHRSAAARSGAIERSYAIPSARAASGSFGAVRSSGARSR